MSKERIKRVAKKMMESDGFKAVSKAMVEEGYSEESAQANCTRITKTKTWKKLMDECFPDEKLSKVHQEGLEASRLMLIDGSPVVVPDHVIRHKYLDTAYKLKGLYKAEKVEHSGLGLDLERLFDAAELRKNGEGNNS